MAPLSISMCNTSYRTPSKPWKWSFEWNGAMVGLPYASKAIFPCRSGNWESPKWSRWSLCLNPCSAGLQSIFRKMCGADNLSNSSAFASIRTAEERSRYGKIRRPSLNRNSDAEEHYRKQTRGYFLTYPEKGEQIIHSKKERASSHENYTGNWIEEGAKIRGVYTNNQCVHNYLSTKVVHSFFNRTRLHTWDLKWFLSAFCSCAACTAQTIGIIPTLWTYRFSPLRWRMTLHKKSLTPEGARPSPQKTRYHPSLRRWVISPSFEPLHEQSSKRWAQGHERRKRIRNWTFILSFRL